MARRLPRERAWASRLQSAFLAALMVAITMLAAWRLMGAWSVVLAATLGVMAALTLERSSLPRRLRNARPLSLPDAPELHGLVDALAERAGLRRPPRLYLISSPAPNAATVGTRDDAAILLTPGLVRGLTERELAGVLAHEISHVRNNDLRLFGFTEVVRRMAVLTSQIGWLLVLFSLPLALLGQAAVPFGTLLLFVAAPAGAHLLQLAILRSRELAADLGAAELTGDPRGLASALRRIEVTNRWVLRALLPVPVPEEPGLARTHPATAERIRRLEELVYATPWGRPLTSRACV